MKTLKRKDVVIVGGGWTGLLMAKELGKRTGLSVVVLERGKPRKTADYFNGMDELDYAIRLRLMQDVSKDTVTFRNTVRQKALPVRQHGPFVPGSGTGGSGEHWNGQVARVSPGGFQLRTHLTNRYGAHRLPDGHALQDWGCSYEDMEPWYTRAEQLLGVSGQAGLYPFEPPRSAPYPTPPLKAGHFPRIFAEAARSKGYHPYPAPGANLSRTYRNPDGIVRPACEYCGFCDRFGCMIGAKAQPTNLLMPVIGTCRNVLITNGATVRRVLHRDGKATGVTWVDERGQEYTQPADIVILASWAISNTRLLLLSGIGEAYDPETRKGQVGKNATHQASGGIAVFMDKPLNAFMGAGASGIAIADLEGDNFDHAPLDFLGGAYVQASSPGYRPISNFGLVPPSVKSTWGSEWKKAALDWYDRVALIQVLGDHFSYKTNYYSLDPTYRDRFGDPLLRLTIDWSDNERRMRSHVASRVADVARAVPGVHSVRPAASFGKYDVTGYRGTHLQGGTIQGGTPGESVLNPVLQCWNMTNLFVLGGSSFPQNTVAGPTLTILAQTLRTAEAIVTRYLKQPALLV
ncbi:MAG TPA: GMC family oxidoreductase [Bryobacteraceae bacterium]|nr:GMC family oxidoreductase [Bryobacteraceae bacterium]